MRKPSSLAELKRKQTTAVVLLGVIGAEFGQDITDTNKKRVEDQRRKSSVVEGGYIAYIVDLVIWNMFVWFSFRFWYW